MEEAAYVVGRVVKAVRGQTVICPALHRRWALVSRDLLALLAGIRPAVEFDYLTGAQQDALCHLAAEVASLATYLPGSTGVQMAVANYDGCYYILRPDLLLARASDPSTVRWIAFATSDASTCCDWASRAESEAVHKQILAMLEALQELCTAEGGFRGKVFYMDECSSAPILPSLNGWLLGYPVAYLLDEAIIDAAADWLSSVVLALHRVMAPCAPLQELLARTGNLSEASRADLDMLCSFTIPAALLASGGDSLEQHMKRWLDVNASSSSNLASLFCQVCMEVKPVRHRVAL